MLTQLAQNHSTYQRLLAGDDGDLVCISITNLKEQDGFFCWNSRVAQEHFHKKCISDGILWVQMRQDHWIAAYLKEKLFCEEKNNN